ncbi:MAG: hypothetical protein HYV28_04350 [Ignavibacteriales bacterium]|nr:hypothetical protein [Ignavibacteriales bacterium]
MRKRAFFFAFITLISANIFSQVRNYTIKDIPKEVKPFIEKGTWVLALQEADLNGDGKMDYVMILTKEDSDPYNDDGQRPLILLIRKPDNSLYMAKRNENIVLCKECGGILGDPFASLKAEKKTFTITHFGGDALRWFYSYTFNYSRVDNTWQLVRAEERSSNIYSPEDDWDSVFTPPKHFGKIDFSDFDPNDFKNRGEK